MLPPPVCFGQFELDPADRQLRRDGEPVELNGRYFDALSLMVREAGRLVTKDRFMEEVWRGVPVTDEALTQCIRTLRKQLGDDAGRPRFIETVPKHGYRFIATIEGKREAASTVLDDEWARFLRLGLAGTIGAGLAGALGGLFYGFLAADPGSGAISILLVLTLLTTALAVIGGAGVAFGIAASSFAREPRWYWPVIGGACGGAIVGAVVRLLGLDAFILLFGSSPGEMTGAPEGAILGAASGLGFLLAARQTQLRVGGPIAFFCGGIAGILIGLLGLHLMGGSLDLLADRFPGSRLRLSGLFGESGFGPVSQTVTSALEGGLFTGCIVVAMHVVTRHAKGASSAPVRMRRRTMF